MKLPTTFIKTIKDIHKQKGEKWLDHFDGLINYCEKRWNMKILSPYELSYNFVAPAILQNGKNVVVKLAVPNEEFYSEVATIKEYAGNGMVKLIDCNLEKGILILERLMPGDTLATIENDEEATLIVAKMMKKLWVPVTKMINVQSIKQREKSLQRIYERFPEGLAPISNDTIREALELFKDLVNSQTESYLLHGDLHHYNILKTSSTDSWLAIDPKGLIGEREYDTIQFLLNKLEGKELQSVIEKRINILVEHLHLDKERILRWGFSHAVLSTCWSLEDEGTYNEEFFQAITIFKQLIFK